mgnify:CR=1 FL=1
MGGFANFVEAISADGVQALLVGHENQDIGFFIGHSVSFMFGRLPSYGLSSRCGMIPIMHILVKSIPLLFRAYILNPVCGRGFF